MRSHMFREDEASKFPAIELLEKLGYEYISPKDIGGLKRGKTTPLLEKVLKEKLEELNSFEYRGEEYKFSDENIEKAIRDIDVPLVEGLAKANKDIYDLLMLGKSYEEFMSDGVRQSFSLRYIDWENIDNNVFHVTEEYKLEKKIPDLDEKHIIPDIVVFVNGIPLGVIEAKRPSISIDEAIGQMIRNQKSNYIPDLFKFVQLVMATNKNDVKYGTCGTPRKFWANWREEDREWQESMLNNLIDDREITKQDRDIVSLFEKNRFMEMIEYFILFDLNVKKVARYQQYFGVKTILDRVEERDSNGNRRSGVIWHTQGSGKSLTMVMLSRYIFNKYRDKTPKVIVVTDRIDLDKQIYETFSHTSLKPSRANTGRHLVDLINDDGADVVTTVVNKFEMAADINDPILSKDIFILVDESHRTQYGKFHNKMKMVFPNSSYLGFTGTPLMKNEKNTMMKFGDLIHSYTMEEAVKDKAVLPLYYEGRMVDQNINQKAIDTHLDIITRNLGKEQKDQIKDEWSKFSRIASSDQRIGLIAFKIYEDYIDRLSNTKFNAMLATTRKIDAIRYWEYFNTFDDIETAVIISNPDTRGDYDDVDEDSKDKEIQFWNKMMDRYGSEERYETSIKEAFIDGEIDILIVVDKLLTGFDSPKAQVMYIDKPLKEHNLLQAIARVNRLEEGKDRGYIIDFRGLLVELDTAMDMYTGSGLENFDAKDLKGALHDSLDIIGELRQDHSNLKDMFISLKNKDDIEEYEVFLADDKIREEFYQNLRKLRKSLDAAVSMENVYNSIEDELKKYESDFKMFYELRKVVSLRYGDSVDNKEFYPQMQRLVDQYIAAEGVSRVSHQINLSDKKEFREELARLGNTSAKADAIHSRISRSINEKYPSNPSYYRKFSEMIEDTINKYKDKRISEKEYLEKMYGYLDEFEKKDIIEYPENIQKSQTAKAFYGSVKDIIKEGEEGYLSDIDNRLGDLSIEMEKAIESLTKVDWHNNRDINNDISQSLDDLLYDFSTEHGLELSWEEIDRIIFEIKKIAHERF